MSTCFQSPLMKRKKTVIGRKLTKVASQSQEKEILFSSSSARLGVKSSLLRIEIPSDLHLPLVTLFKAMVPMPSDHNIFIPVENATFGL